ncbi:hypothetical protein L1887_60830 [Cichorium endivia]|nr:hypothetical protein L1887_60830 [Cichorium endivia]
MAHLEPLDSVARLNEAAAPSYLFKNSHPGSSYPEGNFGGNQLLDGSISLSPLYPSQTNDLHVSIAAGLHPEFPLASPPLRHSSPSFGSRQACSHSNPSQKIKVGRRCTPLGGSRQSASLRLAGLLTPLTRTHVRLLGPCFKTGPNGVPHRPVPGARRYIAETARAANHDRRDGISTSLSTARALAAAPIRTGPRPESIGGPAIAVPHPTGDASPAPIRFPPDNFKHSLTLFSKSFSSFPRGSGHDGALTLSGAPSRGTWARSAAEDASPDYNSDSEAVRFSSWADPGSLAVTKGILGSTMILPQVHPTETLLRLLLPLNDKVQWNSRDVAGGEPPTLRSRSLTELTRQIAPPTKNGHAPPPIESRKSSQSVNPYYVWDLVSFPVLSQIKPQGSTPGGALPSIPLTGITAAAGTRLAPPMDPRLGNLRALLPSLDVVAVSQAPLSGIEPLILRHPSPP